jgi:hypothetical protein
VLLQQLEACTSGPAKDDDLREDSDSDPGYTHKEQYKDDHHRCQFPNKKSSPLIMLIKGFPALFG